MSKPKTTAQNLESRFDAGEDIEVRGRRWAESPLGGKGAAKLFPRRTE
jgi:hypothetical protein